VRGLKISHSVSSSQIKRSNLDDRIIYLFILIHRAISKLLLGFLEQTSDNKIKYWNDISGIVFQLTIQTLIVLEYMITVDI
jgi:hypothetical protein